MAPHTITRNSNHSVCTILPDFGVLKVLWGMPEVVSLQKQHGAIGKKKKLCRLCYNATLPQKPHGESVSVSLYPYSPADFTTIVFAHTL